MLKKESFFKLENGILEKKKNESLHEKRQSTHFMNSLNQKGKKKKKKKRIKNKKKKK